MTCKKCELHKNSQNPCIWGVGNKQAKLMVVGMNPGCFIRGTPVVSDKGLIPIENIRIGDNVLNRYGNYVKVDNIGHRSYYDKLISIKLLGGHTIKCTRTHKILVFDTDICDYGGIGHVRKRCFPCSSKRCPKEYYKKYIPIWKKAEDLEGTEYLLIPRFPTTKKDQVINIRHFDSSRPKYNAKHIPDLVILSPQLAYVFGWYVAEGSSDFNGGVVQFALGLTEMDYAEKIAKIMERTFHLKATIQKGATTITVRIYCRTLCKLFLDYFGKGAQNKRVPLIIKQSPKQVINQFLYGWYLGDGTHRKLARNSNYISTVSKQGAYDIMYLFLKLGIYPVYTEEKPKNYPHKLIQGRLLTYRIGLRSFDQVKLGWSSKHTKGSHKLFVEFKNYIVVPVRRIDNRVTKTTVYNLETETNNYCTPFIVHNSLEDEKGIPFVGPAGKYLDKALEKAGIRRSDIYIDNLVKCRTENNREPSKDETNMCLPYLKEKIKEIKPNVIVLLGNYVCKHLLGKTVIKYIHGKHEWSDELKVNLIPSVHPSSIARDPSSDYYFNMLVEDFKIAKEISLYKGKVNVKKRSVKYIVCNTMPKVNSLFKRLAKAEEFSVDLETTSLNPKKGRILCAQFSWKECTAAVLPLYDYMKKDYWNQVDLETIKYKLKMVLENPKPCKIAQNWKFELSWLKHKFGIIPQGKMWDTMIAHYLINTTNRKHNLDTLSLEYTDMGLYGKEIEKDKENGFRNTPIEKVHNYGAADADCTLRSKHVQESQMTPGYMRLMENILIPLSKVLADMEFRGIKINRDRIKTLIDEIKPKLEALETEMASFPQVKDYVKDKYKALRDKAKEKYLGSKNLQSRYSLDEYVKKVKKPKANFKSNKDLPKILYEYLRLEAPYKTKKGTGYSTDSKALKILQHKHKIISLLLKYRALFKFYSTYLLGVLKNLDDNDRVHTEYKLTRTMTGRMSSKNPNLQNITKKPFEDSEGKVIPLGKLIRECFIVDDDCVLIESDLKQIEFRILAHYCNDPVMIDDIKAGRDVHRIVASSAYKKPQDEISGEERRKAKSITFGIPYGRGAKAIAEDFDMPIMEAEMLSKGFFDRYKKCHKWIKAVIEGTKKHGYVKTIFGRKRLLPNIHSDDEQLARAAEREAIATVIQSTASDILSTYTVNIYNRINREGLKSRLVMTIHDSLVLEVPKDEKTEIIKLLQEEMSRDIFGLRVPVEAETVVGANWADTHNPEEDES